MEILQKDPTLATAEDETGLTALEQWQGNLLQLVVEVRCQSGKDA
jgi:hypothetical protein